MTSREEKEGTANGTHHLHAPYRQQRPLIRARTAEHRLPILARADAPRVREEHPDRVERDGEEVAEEHEWCLVNTVESTHVSGDTQAGLGGKLTQKAG